MRTFFCSLSPFIYLNVYLKKKAIQIKQEFNLCSSRYSCIPCAKCTIAGSQPSYKFNGASAVFISKKKKLIFWPMCCADNLEKDRATTFILRESFQSKIIFKKITS